MYSLSIFPRYSFLGSKVPFWSRISESSSERKSRLGASGRLGILSYRLSLWILVTMLSCVSCSLHHLPRSSCPGPVSFLVRKVPYIRTCSSLCLWSPVGCRVGSGIAGSGRTPGIWDMVMGGTLSPTRAGDSPGLPSMVAIWGWRFRLISSHSLWFVSSRFTAAACWNPALSRCSCDKDASNCSWVPDRGGLAGWVPWFPWLPWLRAATCLRLIWAANSPSL